MLQKSVGNVLVNPLRQCSVSALTGVTEQENKAHPKGLRRMTSTFIGVLNMLSPIFVVVRNWHICFRFYYITAIQYSSYVPVVAVGNAALRIRKRSDSCILT